MDTVIIIVLTALLAVGLTFFATYFYLDKRANSRVRLAQDEADNILEEAETKRRDAAIAAKDDSIRLRAELDRELTQRRKEIERIERRIEQKEEAIDRKSTGLEQREQSLRKQEQGIDQARDAWELERIAGLTADDAKQELVVAVEAEARAMAARRMHEIEQELNEEADRRSRKI